MMLFAERVRTMAAERGMSQKELADRAGMSKQRMNKIWNDPNQDPRLDTICQVANGLGVTVAELLEGVEPYHG